MRKLLLALAIIVALLAVVLAVVAVNLGSIVNKNKETVLARVESTIGRDVSVGDVGIAFRGGLGVRLANVAIGEDPAFGTEPFVEASGLQVNVRLLPLLKKQVQVKRIIVREPLVRIIKNKNGVLNTQSLVERTAAGKAPSGNAPAAAAALPLAISLANVENGEVDYVDEMQGLALRIRKIETSVKDFDLAKPFSMELEAAILADGRNLKIRGTFGPLPKAEARIPGKTPDIPVDVDATVEAVQLSAILEALPRLAASMPRDIRADGPVGVHLTAKGSTADLALTGVLDGSRVDLRGPQGLTKSPGTPLTVTLNGRLAPGKFIIEKGTAQFAKLALNADGEYTLGQPPSIALNIRSENVDLSGWDTIVPLAAPYKLEGKAEATARIAGELKPGLLPSVVGTAKITDGSAAIPQAKNRVSRLGADISFTEARAEVREASFEMGSSRIEGRATIDKFKPLSLTYEATSPSLALADFVPPQPTVKKPEHLDRVVARGRLTLDPVKKEPSGDGTMTSPAGSIANIDYQDLGASYTVAGKTIRITDMKARALEGDIKGGGVITTNEKGSSFDIQVAADKVDITELLTALPGSVQKVLRGTASLNLEISGSGKAWPDIQRTLKGSGAAELSDGEILDVNFATAIFDEIGRYVGAGNLIPAQLKSKYPAVFEQKNTSFKNLKSDFVVENGKLLARNLQLKHTDYRIGAKGSIGFDRSLDVAATFVVSKRLTDDLARNYQAVSFLRNAQGEIELPLVLAGALPRVEVRPDAEFIKNFVGRGMVEKGLDALKKGYLDNLLPSGQKTQAPPDTTRKR